MNKKLIKNATGLAKNIINNKLENGMIAVDATIGNGNDTLQLAIGVGNNGKVYGFDIQRLAIENTRQLLINNNIKSRVQLIHDSHEKLLEYIDEKIDLAIFNLGYLPKGDHSIITNSRSTIKAMESVLNNLNENGILIIVVYYGHEGGKKEKEDVEIYLNNLDQKRFTVLKMDFINQINNPPFVFYIQINNF